MKLISLLIAFCFSFNVLAAAGTIQELEKHLDDFHYTLSVDWDQKDQKFYENQTQLFFGKVKYLMDNDGLTAEQIIKLVEQKIPNKKTMEALKLKMSMIPKTSSPEELARILSESTKDFYNQGASWNGVILIPSVVGILAAAAIFGYAFWFDANHDCVRYEDGVVCYTQTDCYNAGPNFCHNAGYTICQNSKVCSEYRRK